MRSEYRPLILILFLLASVPAFLHIVDPPARDQGVFAQIAWRWIAGDVPYVGAGLEHKGPLPFLGYRLGFQLFGNEMRSARFMAALLILFSGFLVAGLGGRWLNRPIPLNPSVSSEVPLRGWGAPPGVFAGALYLLIVGAGGLSAYWSGAQAEAFMEPFTLLSVVCFSLWIEKGDSSRIAPDESVRAGRILLVLSGFFLGMATLGKPTSLLMAPALLLASPGSRLRVLPALIAGIAIPWIAVAVYFFSRGAFGDFIDAVFLMNASYGARGLLLLPTRLPAFFLSHHVVVNGWFLVPAVAGWFALAERRRDPVIHLLFGWALAAYAQVLIQGRMFGYHYHPVVAPVALLVTAGLIESMRRGRSGGFALRAFAAVLIAALLFAIAGMPWIETEISFRRITGRIPESAFLQHFSPGGRQSDVDPVDTYAAARFAERTIGPEETLLVWGFEPAVNYLSRRRCPTRFIYDYFLTSPAVPVAEREENLRLFWKDLDASPPDWIAVVHDDTNPVESKDSAGQLEEIPALKSYLREKYLAEVQVGDFEFFRRRPGVP